MQIIEYGIPFDEVGVIQMKRGARILTAKVVPDWDFGFILWVLENPNEPEVEDREFVCYRSYEMIPAPSFNRRLDYILTFRVTRTEWERGRKRSYYKDMHVFELSISGE